MKLLKTLLNFYINSNIHVALAVYSLVRITDLYFDLPKNNNLSYFIFFGTIVGYSFIKYATLVKQKNKKISGSLQAIKLLSLVCFIFMVYYGWQINFQTLLLFIPFLLLTFMYGFPFIENSNKTLRSIGYLKLFIVALVWSGVTLLIPLLDSKVIFSLNLVLLFIERMMFIVVLTLPFEIRDMTLDTDNVKTLPQKIGIKKTKKLGLTLLLFCLVIEFLIIDQVEVRNVFIFISMLLLILLMRAKINQSKYYCSLWLESIPILWWVFLLGILNFS